jgi:site-specific DNA-methyltransferase (adenine-specific)
MELNKIYNENCLETMARMSDCFVDLTVTSPPYDGLRTYNGYSFDFESIAKELFRVTKQGGVIVWVVNDETLDGSESGSSFKQALFFISLGFNLETMIWEKTGSGALGSKKFYAQNFEYMFILTKGLPKTTNFIMDRKNVIKQGTVKTNTIVIDTKSKSRIVERKPFGKRTNIWRINQEQQINHPAPFPEKLVADHIYSWSNEGDLVYDCFGGSGTTAKMAHLQKRNWILSEISKEYVELSNKRITPYLNQMMADL